MNQSILKNSDQLSWRLIALCASGVFSLMMVMVVIFVVMVPQERRADLKQLKEHPSLQIKKTGEGKALVRIMSKSDCLAFGQSKVKNWCEIDPKKY